MTKCENCGLFAQATRECVWFKKKLSEAEMESSGEGCIYYMEVIYEDGEPLSTYQHLLLKQEDIASKKMKMPG